MVLWVAIAGFLAWFGLEFLLRRTGESRRWAGSADAGRSTRVLMIAFLVALMVSIVFSLFGVGRAAMALRWAGCGLLLSGLLLRAWSMSVLGASYSRGLQVTESQALVTAGPYRIIRHPGYAGSLLVWVGYALGVGSWAAALLICAALGAAYFYRITSEERMLAREFGAAYHTYQQRTWRLIPGLY